MTVMEGQDLIGLWFEVAGSSRLIFPELQVHR
jgi:hypothetical protein